MEPFTQKVLLYALFSLEDCDRDRTLRHAFSNRLFGYDVFTIQSLVLDHLIPEKFSEAFGGGGGRALSAAVFSEGLAHASILGNQIEKLILA